ncbi:MAG: DUF3135 domain-containing protein [Gammaproteobacteria bacterium]|nr:DUF3135 domain-containing protein [Gammaproteobacteria bacterium]
MIRSDNFDIDEWIELAKQDEGAFETKRSEYLEQFIQQAPAKFHKRMSGVQWTIDMERKLACNPMSSCIKMYGQMWDSLAGKDGLSEKMTKFVAYVDSPELYIEAASTDEPALTGRVVSYR